MAKEMVLDNRKIGQMVSNGVLVKEFTFLNRKKSKKGCCGRTIGTEPDYKVIQQSIISLPSERKQKLKELLGAEKIMIYYQDGNAVSQVTF